MLIKGIAVISLVLAAVLCAFTPVTWWAYPAVFVGVDLGLSLVAFLFLWAVTAPVDMKKPQEEDSKFYRTIMHPYIDALMMLFGTRLHTKGLEQTPTEGRFLLVCNHLSMADPGIVLHCFKKSQLAFITKQENEQLFIIGKIMHKILCQSLDRDNDRQALKVILKCIQIIKNDQASICVFPEGYTSRDGRLQHFRSGAFKIAQKTQVPIVVCTVRNTLALFTNVKKFRRTDVDLHLVTVLQPEDYAGLSTVELAHKVYEIMISDLGEEFRAENP